MTAYLIVQSTVTDEQRYTEYRTAVLPAIELYGGTHIRNGPVELLEGSKDKARVALFVFPSMEAIRAFWASPEYVPIKKLREDAAQLTIWAVPCI